MASSAAATANRAARKVRAASRRPSAAAARARQTAAATAAAPAPAGVGASGWVGVRQRLWGGYAAEIRIPSSRKRVWIGRFEHAVQAAVAYDAAMFLFYGRVLPKLRRYNFPGGPRPPVSEFIRKALTVANVKAIAEDHARRFARFFVPIPHTPPPVPGIVPVVSAAAPPAPAPAFIHVPQPPPPPAVAPLPVPVSGGAASAGGGVVAVDANNTAGAGVAAGAATVAAGAGAASNATAGAGQSDDELYIDADILTAADLQFSGNPVPDEDFVRLMDMDMDLDMDLIFGEI
ncbi:unnamed protein product [Urochloa decumbens]|uniref:AP2/ERF domain-containing protein n=1 Tax=Urochloa decumbens TaxID=240449 RepID=A0ABC9C209_9POAL